MKIILNEQKLGWSYALCYKVNNGEMPACGMLVMQTGSAAFNRKIRR